MKKAILTDEQVIEYASQVVSEDKKLLLLIQINPDLEVLLASYTTDLMLKMFDDKNLIRN